MPSNIGTELDDEDGNDDTKNETRYSKSDDKKDDAKDAGKRDSSDDSSITSFNASIERELLFLQVTTITNFLFRINSKEHSCVDCMCSFSFGAFLFTQLVSVLSIFIQLVSTVQQLSAKTLTREMSQL